MSGSDWAWLAVMLAGCAGLFALARRIEPHRSTRDGTAFTCMVQPLDADGHPTGRWREGRAELVDDRVCIRSRLFLRSTPLADTLRVVARSDDGGRRRAMFVLADPDGRDGYFTLRLPASSPAVAGLDRLVPTD